MSDFVTVRLDGEDYVLRPEGDGTLRVGRRVGGDVTWLDDVDTSVFPPAAREALGRGDASDQALLTAVRGVVQAEIERGG
jgi:hypothetical protein